MSAQQESALQGALAPACSMQLNMYLPTVLLWLRSSFALTAAADVLERALCCHAQGFVYGAISASAAALVGYQLALAWGRRR